MNTFSKSMLRMLGAGVSITFLSTAAMAQVPTVTLPDAIELAVQNHPSVIAARGDIRVAEAGKRENFGSWLPGLSGSSSMSLSPGGRSILDPTTGEIIGSSGGINTQYSAGLSASMTLFDGFRRNYQGRAADASIESAEAALTTQEFNIILQTKQAFFNAVAADELVRVAQTRIQRAERQLQLTRDQLAAGSAIRSDTLRSFVELANARLQIINAQTQRANATAQLAQLIGVDGDVQVVGDPTIDFTMAIDTAALRVEALSNAPTIVQAESQSRTADANLRVSRAQYFPSLSGSYSQNLSGSNIGSLGSSWSARLSLSWPIFNGFSRETNVIRNRVAQDAADARLDDSRRQVHASLTQQFAVIQSAAIRLEIALAGRVAAQEDLRVQQERYRLGAATILEVMNSQINVDQAEVDAVQARLDYLLAKAQIETLVGREI